MAALNVKQPDGNRRQSRIAVPRTTSNSVLPVSEAGSRGNLVRTMNFQLEPSSETDEEKKKSQRGSIMTGIQVSQRLVRKYGSVKAVVKESERLIQANKGVIHPYSSFRFTWDILMIMLIAVIIYLFPVFLAFPAFDFNSHYGHSSSCTHRYTAMVIQIVTDIFFATDILLNFRTGIVENEAENIITLDPKRIRNEYIKLWFWLDLIATIPLSVLVESFGGEGDGLGIVRMAKLLQLLRLVRFTKVFRTKHQWGEIELFQYDTAVLGLKFLGVVGIIMTFCHLSACVQFMVPLLNDIPPDCWIASRNLQYKHFYIQYFWSLFRAISQMICIGYGLFPPSSRLDKMVTMSMMISGAILFASCIGILTSIVQSHNASKRLYKEKIASVKQYMTFRKLPVELRKRISDYYENRYQGKMFNEEQILKELNPVLREELIDHTCRELVDAVPMFLESDSEFVTDLLTKLKFEVYLYGDEIIRQGTIGRKMFFISRGTVRILSYRNLDSSRVLADGDYFGEIALLHPTNRRTASVFAESYCYLYSLDVEDLNAVLDEFPHVRREFMNEAAARLESMENEEQDLNGQPDPGISFEVSRASVQDWYKRSSRSSKMRTMSTTSRQSMLRESRMSRASVTKKTRRQTKTRA